jgi:hypothetical protein
MHSGEMHSGNEHGKHVSQRFVISAQLMRYLWGTHYASSLELSVLRSDLHSRRLALSTASHEGITMYRETNAEMQGETGILKDCLMGLAMPKLDPEMQTADICRLLWLLIQLENHKYDN